MRKTDYATLAQLLRQPIDELKARRNKVGPVLYATLADKALCAEEVARGFAARASVDSAAFLKACGID